MRYRRMQDADAAELVYHVVFPISARQAHRECTSGVEAPSSNVKVQLPDTDPCMRIKPLPSSVLEEHWHTRRQALLAYKVLTECHIRVTE